MDVGNGEEVREKCVVYLVEKFISIVYLWFIDVRKWIYRSYKYSSNKVNWKFYYVWKKSNDEIKRILDFSCEWKIVDVYF